MDPKKNRVDYFLFEEKKGVGRHFANAFAMIMRMGGVRSRNTLQPMLMNLQCWVNPVQYALGRAGEAFDGEGELHSPAQYNGVRAVVDKTLWAAAKLNAA